MADEETNQPLVQTDWEILGWIISSYVAAIVILVLLMNLYRNRSNIVQTEMKTPTIISLIGGLVFCVTVGFFRSDLVISSFQFEDPAKLECIIPFGITWNAYTVQKTALYFVFTSRLRSVFYETFRSAKYHYYAAVTFIIVIGIPLGLSSGWTLPRTAAITPIHNVHFCTGLLVMEQIETYGVLSTVFSTLFDLFMNIYLVGLFCWYFYRILRVISSNTDDRPELINNVKRTMLKSVVVVSVSTVSSIVFLIVGNFIYWPIGWFVPVHAMIAALAIYCLFEFADSTYNRLCFPFVCCCGCCFGVKAKIAKHSQNTALETVSSEDDMSPKQNVEDTLYETACLSEMTQTAARPELSEKSVL